MKSRNRNFYDVPVFHYSVISGYISRNHPLIIPYKSYPQPPYESSLKKYHFHKGTAYLKLISRYLPVQRVAFYQSW